jgi:hypothetical protein
MPAAKKPQRVMNAVTMPSSDTESLRIRKIKNGWIISRSGTNAGKYFDEDEFTAKRPKLSAEPVKKERGNVKR